MKRRPYQLMLSYYEQMVLVYPQLSEREKCDLDAFEKKRPTSEWPGWKKYLSNKTA